MDWMLVTGILLAILAVLSQLVERDKAAIMLLVAAAFFLRLYAAYLDPFLHDWDEKYHALVARNFMDDPFYPVLKKGIVIPFDYKTWCCNEVWLHKQPLFMWQMALSMKIFGVSEFSIRYPSVLLGAIMVYFVYRISFRLSNDKNLPFGAALLMCFSNYHLELTSGYHGMDHNDVAFGFYVLGSIWAFGEYRHKQNKLLWLVLIGFFAGCAVLNKWLTGILVYAGWGLSILFSIRKPAARKEIIHLLLSFTVCILVFLPWQLYIHTRFPKEAKLEMENNTRHVFEVFEGHGGTELFYWDRFPNYFGINVWWLVPVGLILILFVRAYDRGVKIMLVSSILIVFIFFSFIVRSKLNSYFFVVAPIAFILMAVPASRLGLLTKRPWIAILLYTAVAFWIFEFHDFNNRRDPKDGNRLAKIHNTKVYKQLQDHLPPGYHVVANLIQYADVECMFFNRGISAYHFNLSPEELNLIRSKNLKLAVFKNHPWYPISEHVYSYPDLYIINLDLKEQQ